MSKFKNRKNKKKNITITDRPCFGLLLILMLMLSLQGGVMGVGGGGGDGVW